jgi:hypothetical protein
VLSVTASEKKIAALSVADRQAILEILRDTKPQLPTSAKAEWGIFPGSFAPFPQTHPFKLLIL